MKTKATFFAIMLIASTVFTQKLNAQAAEPMDYKGVSLIGAGISLGYYSYGILGSRSISIPPLSAYYELGVHNRITAGPFVGFARWSYRGAFDYSYSWTYLQGGIRASYHFTGLINELLDMEIDENKLDIYLTLMGGLEYRAYSSSFDSGVSNKIGIILGPVGGFRYYLTDNLAVFVEGGRGSFGALYLGVSARF